MIFNRSLTVGLDRWLLYRLIHLLFFNAQKIAYFVT